MKRIFLVITLTILSSLALGAQELTTQKAVLDSTLLGRDIFNAIGAGVKVEQSADIRQAVAKYIESNKAKTLSGYRIRVYYDNSPQARDRSESIAASLKEQYPEMGVYRSFQSPNYKVLIGDFRSKDEALRVFNALRKVYPTAYIIKDAINYPL
ncbi:MAG: SPOR domain-containing protein [Bacteroidales bacterium]|nr:SPOR domain-containing protein [Bacteroidales bacterium]MBR1783426.1 SPOR domain-containing protein [Bacteroidales bacterium]